MKESEIDNLESFIPSLAKGAVQKAYIDTLSSGNSVVEVIDNSIYEVFADGTKNKVKDIAPHIKVDMSKKIQLR